MPGLLGPNGAGKTTLIRVLPRCCGLTRAATGWPGSTCSRSDYRPYPPRPGRSVRRRRRYLTGRENVVMVGRLYNLSWLRPGGSLPTVLGLHPPADAADRPVRPIPAVCAVAWTWPSVHGGAAPEVLFLDEPTTGSTPDPPADIRELIVDMVAGGTTILLTTQYLRRRINWPPGSGSSTTVGWLRGHPRRAQGQAGAVVEVVRLDGGWRPLRRCDSTINPRRRGAAPSKRGRRADNDSGPGRFPYSGGGGAAPWRPTSVPILDIAPRSPPSTTCSCRLRAVEAGGQAADDGAAHGGEGAAEGQPDDRHHRACPHGPLRHAAKDPWSSPGATFGASFACPSYCWSPPFNR